MNNYYDWLQANDIIEILKPLLEKGGFTLRDVDGKLEATGVMAHDTPWHHVKHAWGLDCGTWHRIIFDFISAKLPPGVAFVPSKCQQCWKIVARPGTLKQLFALEALQQRLNKPSKCGIEVRPSVHGLYGGYWYTGSLQEGLERYKEVRSAVDADDLLGPDVPVFLKRACTEFEHLVGDSRKWQISEYQLALEQLVDRYVSKDDTRRDQPEHLVWHVHRRWIEWAYAAGDKTVFEFTDGQPLYPDYVKYEHLADKPPEEIEQFFNESIA
jgi:hypothetical protein